MRKGNRNKKKKRNDKVPLSRTIYLLSQEIHTGANHILKPCDLTMEQLYLLQILSENDTGGLPQKKISEKALKTPANITRMMDRLERKSLIVRKTCPNDRRIFLVELTELGHSIRHEATAVLECFFSQIFSGIDSEAVKTAKRVLDAMRANAEKTSLGIRP